MAETIDQTNIERVLGLIGAWEHFDAEGGPDMLDELDRMGAMPARRLPHWTRGRWEVQYSGMGWEPRNGEDAGTGGDGQW